VVGPFSFSLEKLKILQIEEKKNIRTGYILIFLAPRTFNIKIMRKIISLFLMALVVGSCQPTSQPQETDAPLITKNQLQLSSDIMTPEVLWSFGRLGDVQVSPDGTQLLYGVSYYSIEQNKSNRELFLMNADGSGKTQLTESPENEFNAIWHPDGQKIVYLSSASGGVQAWVMNADGTGKKKISEIDGGINSLSFAPSGDKVLYTKDVQIDLTTLDHHTDLPESDARIIDDLMYRHWDTWEDGAYSHIFVADFDGNEVAEGKDIMPGEPYDSPLRPFGGMEEIAWAPD
jgi:hypothetical protein